MNIKNDTEETKKLKELFYTAEKENIELAFTIAQSTDNQQFLNFYKEWQGICNFYHKHHAMGWSSLSDLSNLLLKIKTNGLFLSNLGLLSFPNFFAAAGEICESLNLNHNDLFSVPEVLQHFGRLKSLNMERCSLSLLPDWLFGLENLEYLNLNYNLISELSPQIESLSKLQGFSFILQGFCPLPLELSELANLKHLAYGARQRTEETVVFPTTILACKNLSSLNLTGLDLIELPQQLADLSNLQELHLHNCRMEHENFDFCQLPQLRKLSLVGGHIRQIPTTVFDCLQLEELNLSGTQINEIPSEISKLQNLKYLNLADVCINSNSIEFWESQLRRWLPQTEVEWGFF